MEKEIRALSHREFDNIMRLNKIKDKNVENFKDLFLISIVDSFKDCDPWFKTNHKNVLNLVFDDIHDDTDYERAVVFSLEQAKEVVDFLESIDVNNFSVLVHCAAGVSRSGAISAFVSDYFRLDYNDFKQMNPHICPNATVSRKLNKVLRERD